MQPYGEGISGSSGVDVDYSNSVYFFEGLITEKAGAHHLDLLDELAFF